MNKTTNFKSRLRTLSYVIYGILVLCMTSSPQESSNTPSPYLLLYAFDAEGELLAEKMDNKVTDTILGRAVHSGSLVGLDIILAESGIGMTNAAMTTQRLIDKYQPQGIIFSGIAGGIDSSVHIGDIVVCECWATHDYGYHGADGLKPGDIEVFSPDENKVLEITEFHIDSILLVKAFKLNEKEIVLKKIGKREPILSIGGVCVSGNTFIDNVDRRKWLAEHFGAKTVDMESAAVAHVAHANDIPYIIFRSASDLAGGSGSESARSEISQFFKVAALNSASVVIEYLSILGR